MVSKQGGEKTAPKSKTSTAKTRTRTRSSARVIVEAMTDENKRRGTKSRRSQEQITLDTERLTRMMARGVPRDQMATTLGISRSQLDKDITAIEREIGKQAIDNLDQRRGSIKNKLIYVADEALRAWEASKMPVVKSSKEQGIKGDKDVDVAKVETMTQGGIVIDGVLQTDAAEQVRKGNPGDPRHLKVALEALGQIATLEGLNAPTKIAPTTPDGTEAYKPGFSLDDFAPLLDAAREYEKARAAHEQFERLATGGANAATSGS